MHVQRGQPASAADHTGAGDTHLDLGRGSGDGQGGGICLAAEMAPGLAVAEGHVVGDVAEQWDCLLWWRPSLRLDRRRAGAVAALGAAVAAVPLARLLDGLAQADSIAFDLHKFGWTPASSSVLLVRDQEHMRCLTQQAVYLNPSDDEAAGYTALLGTSLQTTRRSDAFKIVASLLAVGREGMGAWVDACHAQARHAAARIAASPDLHLVADPVLSTVIFRCRPAKASPVADESAWNAAVRRQLMVQGRALLARTKVRRADGTLQVHLKLVFLNPTTTNEASARWGRTEAPHRAAVSALRRRRCPADALAVGAVPEGS